MTNVPCESSPHSLVKSSMHPCLGNWVAIGHQVIYNAWMPTHLVQELNAGTVEQCEGVISQGNPII